MTGCSPRQPARRLDRGRAHSAFLINQLATPGLGSLIAGRRLAGVGQLLLALTGFGLVTAWFIQMIISYYSLMFSDTVTAEPNLRHGLWQGGVAFFGTAWLWALVTSLSLLRTARKEALVGDADVPPKIVAPTTEASARQ